MLFMPMAIQNANGDSWVGIIKMGGLIAVFVIILQMVVNLSFQMIRFIPDQVLGWLGGNMQNQIGAQAQDEVGSAAKNSIGARGTVSSASGKQQQLFQQRKADKHHGELLAAQNGKGNPAMPVSKLTGGFD